MSDTPRVDAAEIRHGKEGYSYLTVSVEFARPLERELCRLTADNERLREALREIADETYDTWTNGAKAQRIAESALKEDKQ